MREIKFEFAKRFPPLRLLKLCPVFVLLTGLSACSAISIVSGDKDSGPRPGSVDVSSVPDAVPKVEPRSKYGNPASYVVLGKRYYVMNDSKGFVERGIASWYGRKFHGRRTSNGETYDMYAMTAAHKTLPLPTYVEVTNLKNGRNVIVRVNDRGPFHENRIIDLSYTAAAKLDIISTGTGWVEIRAIDPVRYAKNKSVIKTSAPVVHKDFPGFYIQVGAFSDRVNAQRMYQKLRTLGKLVGIYEAVVNGQLLYRVRIGPIKEVDQADKLVARLYEYGVTEHHIVVN